LEMSNAKGGRGKGKFSPCRKLFKTVGFERASKTSDVRYPPSPTKQINIGEVDNMWRRITIAMIFWLKHYTPN